MAGTIEPRIQITPSPATGPLLRELAELTGTPASKIVRDLLDEMAPMMPAMIEALRLVKSRPDAAQAAFSNMAAKAHGDLAQATLDLSASLRKRPGRKPGKPSGRGAAKAR